MSIIFFCQDVTEVERILVVSYSDYVTCSLRCVVLNGCRSISSHFQVVTGHTLKRLMESVLFVSFQSDGRCDVVSMEFPALELKANLNKHLLLFTALTSLLVVVCLSMVSSCTKRKLPLSS